MTVQVFITVPNLKTTKEGQAFCAALVQQLVECPVNDDNSIERIVYSVPKKGTGA
jgi:hypothetical protein